MPNRILREGILTSPKVAKLGWAEEVMYRRLMSLVDDYGRYFADPSLLRGHVYPRQLNKVSDSDVGKWLQGIEAAGLVRVYPAKDGERYLELLNFGQQIRAQKSKFPDPIDSASKCEQPIANEHLVVFESVSVSEGVSRKSATPTRARKFPIPDEFGISPRVRAWAAEKGFQRLEEHLEAFRNKAKAKSYAYADWDLAFMEAVREDWAKLRGNGRTAAPAGESITVPSSAADQTAEYLRSREMTPQEREAAERARRMVMSSIKVVNSK